MKDKNGEVTVKRSTLANRERDLALLQNLKEMMKLYKRADAGMTKTIRFLTKSFNQLLHVF